MNFSHFAQSCYTSFIINFDGITTTTEFRQFYRQLRLGLAESSHQIYLESFLHSALTNFPVDYEQVDISLVILCFSDT